MRVEEGSREREREKMYSRRESETERGGVRGLCSLRGVVGVREVGGEGRWDATDRWEGLGVAEGFSGGAGRALIAGEGGWGRALEGRRERENCTLGGREGCAVCGVVAVVGGAHTCEEDAR